MSHSNQADHRPISKRLFTLTSQWPRPSIRAYLKESVGLCHHTIYLFILLGLGRQVGRQIQHYSLCNGSALPNLATKYSKLIYLTVDFFFNFLISHFISFLLTLLSVFFSSIHFFNVISLLLFSHFLSSYQFSGP